MVQDLKRVENKDSIVEKCDYVYYAYKICGEIIDIEKRLVRVGEIVIEIEDNIPKDICEYEFIEFNVMRIDFYE